MTGEAWREGSRLLTTRLRERDVRASGVTAVARPLGLTVADEPDLALGRGVRAQLPVPVGGEKNSRGFQPNRAASGIPGKVVIRVLYR